MIEFGDARLPERFWAKAAHDPSTGCWLWTGSVYRGGYGKIQWGSKHDGNARLMPAHRWAYEALVEPIADGLVIDHLCRMPPCVRPDHLEAVTTGENTRRGEFSRTVAGAWQRSRTHCPAGHPYESWNIVASNRGKRQCKTCAYAQGARRRETLRAQRQGVAESVEVDPLMRRQR